MLFSQGACTMRCRKCGEEKLELAFYKGRARCKECLYAEALEYRASEGGRLARKRERLAARACGKYKEWQSVYEAKPKAKERHRRYQKKRYSGELGKARMAGMNAVKYALRMGRLKKTACEVCGSERTEAHHASYALDMRLCVTWLCSADHNAIHNPSGA